MKLLKQYRKATGLKQYEAANILNITKDYLCMLENGKRKPGRRLIFKMAELYNVGPEEIFLAAAGTADAVQKDDSRKTD